LKLYKRNTFKNGNSFWNNEWFMIKESLCIEMR